MSAVPALFMFRLPPIWFPPASVTEPPVVVTLPDTPPVVVPAMFTVAAPASLMFSIPTKLTPLLVNVPLVVALNVLYVTALPLVTLAPAPPAPTAAHLQTDPTPLFVPHMPAL